MNLDQNDTRQLEAARGWLGLGDWKSASDELDQITPKMRAHPDVLQMRVEIYCAARRFDLASSVSDGFANVVPCGAQFWYNRAVALCQVGRTREARTAIAICFDLEPDSLPAAHLNPDLAAIWASLPSLQSFLAYCNINKTDGRNESDGDAATEARVIFGSDS